MRVLAGDMTLGSIIKSGGAGLLLATLAVSGCSHKEPPAPAPASVQFVVVHSQAITLTIDLPGRTVAYRTAEIRPQISGIVQKRMFVEGRDVKAGQQLYQIDPALYRATLDSAAAMASASAALVERYRPLEAAQAVSRQDFDNAVASAAQSKAATETAKINLVYTRLLAPISGRIGRSAVTEGALVTADQAVPFPALRFSICDAYLARSAQAQQLLLDTRGCEPSAPGAKRSSGVRRIGRPAVGRRPAVERDHHRPTALEIGRGIRANLVESGTLRRGSAVA
jgi:multidrug efflux pump subunit AcrA (membrane-fusion protein)